MTKATSIMNPSAPGQSIRVAFRPLTSRLRGVFEEHRRNKIRRYAFLNLLRLDDEILEDIGVTRAEVEDAARLPLHVNASQALADKALARRKGQIG
ncbi:DUF1127 domain-containing protein [Paracoccus litorisediminis]|nr:DUF1127 domain-containing protein [Paracoccus litorisediminis]